MRKIFLVLFTCLIASNVYADLTIALKQKGDDIFITVQDAKEEYSCDGIEIVKDNGKVIEIITCCNCKDECIEIVIPTHKTGT